MDCASRSLTGGSSGDRPIPCSGISSPWRFLRCPYGSLRPCRQRLTSRPNSPFAPVWFALRGFSLPGPFLPCPSPPPSTRHVRPGETLDVLPLHPRARISRTGPYPIPDSEFGILKSGTRGAPVHGAASREHGAVEVIYSIPTLFLLTTQHGAVGCVPT